MSARLTPGGALLRNSRLFSVPNPIPGPAGNTGTLHYQSPTATTSFPTHLAITTTEASRRRGDWGLKRPLPLKTTTKTSTPSIRVKHVDSIDSVTDFSSAADHSLSLRKFQELNLPMTVPSPSNQLVMGAIPEPRSVFEEESDFIALAPGQGASMDKRWKFKGPWLAGLTEGEFSHYISKRVRNRRRGFRFYLKGKLAEEINARQQQEALQTGTEAPPPIQGKEITDEQLTEYTRNLRTDRVTLYSLVGEFLDLAPLNPPKALTSLSAVRSFAQNPYAKDGPPITHPSGGLSYLRTASYAENHPVYGPQAHHTPVLARIVQPRAGAVPAKLGVGGFITNTPTGDTAFNNRSFAGSRKTVDGIVRFDPDIRGGAKAFIHPVSAKMEPSGNVSIKTGEANEEAEVIYKEMIGKATIYTDKSVPDPMPEPRDFSTPPYFFGPSGSKSGSPGWKGLFTRADESGNN